MKSPSAMPEIRPLNYSPRDAERGISIRDSVLLGLVLLTLVPAGEALAGDQAAIFGAADAGVNNRRQFSPLVAAPMSATPMEGLWSPPTVDINPAFSATDFRPRKHTLFDNDAADASLGETPMLRGTTIWQRMSQYKSRDRVRLLTLWESSGSTVSLQAGKHGDPSLQWTSRVMNRGGSTQGLFDRFFSVSLAHVGSGLRSPAKAPGPPAANSQARASAIANLK
jgi:hypothetical protein